MAEAQLAAVYLATNIDSMQASNSDVLHELTMPDISLIAASVTVAL